MYKIVLIIDSSGYVNGRPDMDIYSFTLDQQNLTAKLTSKSTTQFTMQLVTPTGVLPGYQIYNNLFIHTLIPIQGDYSIMVYGNVTLDYELQVSNCSKDPISCAAKEGLDVIACECVAGNL